MCFFTLIRIRIGKNLDQDPFKTYTDPKHWIVFRIRPDLGSGSRSGSIRDISYLYSNTVALKAGSGSC
jgi:hypothetical protein